MGRTGLATAVALQLAELAGAGVELAGGAELIGADDEVLVDGAAEAAGCSVDADSGEQATVSVSVVDSSSVSRRMLQP